ncbi:MULTISPECIES: PH domain-containing protein [unclassified Streptomyces]|uniref:PH domain-containing protein n=1 Tax=unclassified Streptomyces TaxID=2593676 RepID=UPI0033A94B27
MDELIFRAKDRHRPSWRHIVPVLLICVLQGVFFFRDADMVTASCVSGALLVLWGVSFFLVRRSGTTVGADGITISWGMGRGRTHPWNQIRWIDVRETRTNSGTVRTARITLTGGQRRSLPALSHSNLYPLPDFDTDVQQVLNWWELSTDPTMRFQPPKRPLDRITPQALGVVLGLVTTAVIVLVVLAQN